MPLAAGRMRHAWKQALGSCIVVSLITAAAARAEAGPHIEAGQRWEYESPPKEYGGSLTVLSYDGATAVVSVRYLFPPTSVFVQVELSGAELEKALTKPADPEGEQPPAVRTPFPCRVYEYGLVECLEAVHILRNVE